MKQPTEEQLLATMAALPAPDLLQPSRIDDPVGTDAFYSARTVATLLVAERTRCRYPECLDNPDERCVRLLLGECEGPLAQG